MLVSFGHGEVPVESASHVTRRARLPSSHAILSQADRSPICMPCEGSNRFCLSSTLRWPRF